MLLSQFVIFLSERRRVISALLGLIFTVLAIAMATTPGRAAEDEATVRTGEVQKVRNYPGGRDEEDLKVQETLPVPTVAADRRSIELKVLNSYFKKSAGGADSTTKPE